MYTYNNKTMYEFGKFEDILKQKEYHYHYRDGSTLIIDHKRSVNLDSLISLPKNIQFNNEGNVDLYSIILLPKNIQFNNEGNVRLHSLISLPENIQFNNEENIYLYSLTSLPESTQFNNGGKVYLASLTSLPKNKYEIFNNAGEVFYDWDGNSWKRFDPNTEKSSLKKNILSKFKEFEKILKQKRYSYHINELDLIVNPEEGVLIVDPEERVWLSSLTALPDNIQFNNGGYVNLRSLTSLPENTQFYNRGNIWLNSLISLPKNIQFNNEGNVYLDSLTTLPENKYEIFKNGGKVYYDWNGNNWKIIDPDVKKFSKFPFEPYDLITTKKTQLKYPRRIFTVIESKYMKAKNCLSIQWLKTINMYRNFRIATPEEINDYIERKNTVTINGYTSKIEGEEISFGCAHFVKDQFHHILAFNDLDRYLSSSDFLNRKIISIKLDSGIEITVEQIKKLIK